MMIKCIKYKCNQLQRLRYHRSLLVTQQPHFTYSDQQVPPAHEVNHQQAEFEHIAQDYHQLQQSGYLQPVPTVAMEGQEYNVPPPSVAGWPQLGGPSAPFPSIPHVLPSSHKILVFIVCLGPCY